MNKKTKSLLGILCGIVFVVLLIFVFFTMSLAVNLDSPDAELDDWDEVSDVPSVFSYVASGDLDGVRKELDSGTDINVLHPRNQRSLLHYAVSYQQDEIAIFLINNGIDKDTKNAYGTTPIMSVVYSGNQVLYDLLKDDCYLKVEDNMGNSLLHLSAASGKIEIFQDLMERGLDITQKNNYEKEPIYYSYDQEMLEMILEHMGIDVITSDMAQKLLFTAVSGEIIGYLIDENIVDINTISEEGYNALFYSIFSGTIDTFEMLIQKGIDVNYQDSEGNTALHICAFDGFEENAQLLLDANADISIRNAEGMTPAEVAKKFGNESVYDLLVGGMREH